MQGNTMCSTDMICKLVNDSNAKISTAALGDLTKSLHALKDKPLIYKSILQNLGSANMTVRKASEQACKQICETETDKQSLLSVLVSTATFSTNQRQKSAIVEQLIDVVEVALEGDTESTLKQVLPLSFKLLEDTRADVKQRTERLLKKLNCLPVVREAMIGQCPMKHQ